MRRKGLLLSPLREEEASESCFCSETLDSRLGIPGELQHTVYEYIYLYHKNASDQRDSSCYHHQKLPPILSLFPIPEVSRSRQFLVQISAHLSPHFSLLAQSSFQLGSKIVTGLGEGVGLARCQTYMVQHALWARYPLQAHVTGPVCRYVFIWRTRDKLFLFLSLLWHSCSVFFVCVGVWNNSGRYGNIFGEITKAIPPGIIVWLSCRDVISLWNLCCAEQRFRRYCAILEVSVTKMCFLPLGPPHSMISLRRWNTNTGQGHDYEL